MALPITAPCSREFLPAAHSSGTRSLDAVWWIVMHDEEAPNARGAALYFKSEQSGGSAHLTEDDKECYRCLDDNVIPWGAVSPFGANTHGFHIEQSGYARWSAVVWMKHWRALDRAAYKAAIHCKRFGIPVRWVPASQLPAMRGITSHAEVSKASRRLDPANAWWYSHSDPGLFWPRRWFMRRVRHWTALL